MENLERLFTLVGCTTESEVTKMSELRFTVGELHRSGYLNDENYFQWENENDETLIEVAIEAGNTAMVGVLLEDGNNDMLYEAFVAACQKHNEEVLKFLLLSNSHHKMDIHQQSNCILICTKHGYSRMLQMLHRAGFSLSIECGLTKLNSPKTTKVPFLWSWQTDGSLLHVAAGNGHHQIVDYLIEQDADIESVDSCGRKPVHLAVQGGMHCLRRLLQEGVDIEAADNDGHSPLFLAASFGNFTALKTLVKYGAELDTCNDEGFSALLAAASANHERIVKYLLDKGVIFVGLRQNKKNFDTNLHLSGSAEKKRLNEIEEDANWVSLEELEEGGNALPVARLKLHMGVNPEIIFAEAFQKGQQHVINLLDELYSLENTVLLALNRTSLKTLADIIMSFAFPRRGSSV